MAGVPKTARAAVLVAVRQPLEIREVQVRKMRGSEPSAGSEAICWLGVRLDVQRFKRGSSTSRRPSPTRLQPITVTRIATPGKVATQGAVRRNC
jgi:hypothetical protein